MRIETPRGAVFSANGQKAVLEWNQNFQPKWQGRYSRAQAFVDSEVLRLSTPFIPFRTSFLMKTGTLGTVIGSGLVEWVAPYARYQYYGKVMVGKPPKQLTDRDLTYDKTKNPQAGAFWFERMKADHKQDILAGARRIAGGSR